MPLDQTSVPFVFTKPMRSTGLCSQHLHHKVAIRILVHHTKRQARTALWSILNYIRLLASWALTSCVLASLLLYAGISHAAEKELQQKSVTPVAMPMDLIELLGELGDGEADLDAAMSSVETNQATKKLMQTEQQTKPVAIENSNTGAKK